ncbi:phosphatase PAP2 family protein [Corynebacterium tapiri]|uniref:Phosphatase PAP2 family protein n=1 Tax=Corynebacterium tapiri TaxID=1448266 RepID=A0A5C4U2G6_9CORY|nr:phosphatase PAP2 family protein [Corynebacterium tapiri]TNL95588.1 phosphatase PAP2 family protein [Corynebacterium tapiri]
MDYAVWEWMVAHRLPSMNQAVILFSEVFRPLYLALATVALAVVCRIRGARVAWVDEAAIAVIVTNAVVHLLKPIIDRARPDVAEQLVVHTSGAMPSGHAAAAMALAVVVASHVPAHGLRVLVLLWAVAVGASRLYLGVHWLSDILVGVGIGASIALVLRTTHRGRKLTQG